MPSAPISGSIAIVCGLVSGCSVIWVCIDGTEGAWLSSITVLCAFASSLFTWRGMKEQNRQYLERLERLEVLGLPLR